LPGFETRFAEVKGVRMRYFIGGEGRPLVLVHGLAGAATNWTLLAPLLAERRRVLVPDLPGHGGSSPLPSVPNLNPLADRVGALAALEAMLPAPIVGHSMGGVVALRLGLRRPRDVQALVLAAVAGISSIGRRAEIAFGVVSVLKPARLLAPHRRRIAHSRVLRTLVFGNWEVSDPAALSPSAVEGFLAGPALHTDVDGAGWALVRDDPRTDLGRLRCPALVLWGARDRLVPVEDGFEYARRLGAPLRVVPDCAHLLIGERPDACREAIEDFLDDRGL
jgi:pimeloyl-ACP methyl ester carboxylesterase